MRAKNELLFLLIAAAAHSTSSYAQGMVTSGQAGTNSGAATFTIPIRVPPGVTGVTPQLALVYNSLAGNGQLGIGWGLSGLSAITRCPKTKPQDGVISPVNFDINDGYCLDGQRLVRKSGTYGADGSEYGTEIESFSKIVAYGSAGLAGPAYFKVWTKAGEIIEYGNTTDSRVEAQGKATVRVWAMNRLSDTKSNYQDFVYLEDAANSDYYITSIKYTGNSGPFLPTLPNLEVRFTYETTAVRKDIRDFRLAGTRIKPSPLRLLKIESFSGTTKATEYQLDYRSQIEGTPSRLSTIKQCSASSCLPPLTLSWLDHSDNLVHQGTIATNIHPEFASAADRVFAGDFNGDGKLDVLLGPGNSGKWYVMKSTGTGLDAGSIWLSAASFGTYGNWEQKARWIHVMDVNADGLSDVVLGPDDNGSWFVLRSTGSSFAGPEQWATGLYSTYKDTPERFHPAEVDGDGRADFIFGPSSEGYWRVIRSTGSTLVDGGGGWSITSPATGTFYDSAARVRIMDVNGDGLSDAVAGPEAGSGKWYVIRSSGASLVDDGLWASGVYANWSSNDSQKRVRVTDFNGDGLADILIGPEKSTGGTWYLLRSNGKIFENVSPVAVTPAYKDWNDNSDRIRNMDLNGDGMSDVLLGPEPTGNASTGNWYALLSKGTTFYDRSAIASGYGDWDTSNEQALTREMDLTGDGLPDIVMGPDGVGNWFMLKSALPGHLVSSIADGFNQSVSFNYKPLTDSTVYTKETGSTYPTADLQTPMWVVSSMVSTNGIGGDVTTSYTYGGLKSEVDGRGSLGFHWIEEKDQARNITVRTEYSQTWPFVGMPERVVTTSRPVGGPDVVLKDVNYSVICVNPVSGYYCSLAPELRYFPYVYSITEYSKDLNGATLPSVTTNLVYDASSGNAKQINVNATDGFSRSTVNTYTDDTSKWFLGRLTRTTVTSTWGSNTLTRTSGFTYDPDYGLLNKEIVEPDNPDLCLVTEYRFDDFGNRTRSTTRNCNGSTGEAGPPFGAASFATRISRAVYDSRGRFPTSAINALNQSETTSFEPVFGNLLSQTGPNGITTTWSYDQFGRRTLETRADGTRTKWDYLYCSGYGGSEACPNYGSSNYATYVVQETPIASDGVIQNGPLTRTYFDPLDRPIRVETQAFDGTSRSYADVWYDALGHVQWTSRPYYSTQSAWWSFFHYDALDRPDYEWHPNSVGSAVYTYYTYDGLTRSVKNQLLQIETRTINSQGWLMSSKDHTGQTLSYQYDGYGNLTQTTDPAANVTSMGYDLRGRKTSMTDRDMGAWSYVYNAAGELTSQTNARNETTTLAYDLLGRMTQRVEPSMTANWTYDRYADGSTCAKGIGKLCESTATGTGASNYRRQHFYDSLGRPGSTNVALNTTATTSVTYDTQGRIATQTYPTGLANRYVYTELGYLKEVRDNASNALYWRADSVDAEGHVTQQTYGNNVVTTQNFEAPTGRLKQVLAGPNNSVQAFTYNYDDIGRLKDRSDATQSLTETFGYDKLNRLTSAALSSPAASYTTTYGYNGIGNLTSRSDLGSLVYPASGASSTRPHALSQVNYTGGGRKDYGYDANGNVTNETAYDSAGNTVPAKNRSALYLSFNKPYRLTNPAQQAIFTYDSEYQRHYQQNDYGSSFNQIWYLHPDSSNGLLYEREIQQPGFVLYEHRHYITAGGVVVAMVKQNPTLGTSTTVYFHRDNLGSVTTVTDASGNVVERLAYDSFGKRRSPNGQADPNNTLTSTQTDRGYTNHQELDSLDLINANGRIYDPVTGRFQSADPFVQIPSALQSHNRYSYTFNNPLAFVDPSGYGVIGKITGAVKGVGRAIGNVADSIANRIGNIGIRDLAAFGIRYYGYSASAACEGAYALCAAAVNAAAYEVQTSGGGSRNSRTAPGSSYAFNQQGSIGPFRQGGAQAFQQGEPQVDYPSSSLDPYINIAINVTLGGTSSPRNGEKSANGAVRGAFGYLFNHAMHAAANDPNYHRYEFENEICSTSSASCTTGNVFDGLRRYPAPGHDPSSPVMTGDRTETRVFGISGGTVRHFVDAPALTVYNITEPGHIFDPGYVSRSVLLRGDFIYVRTIGEGTGNYRFFNTTVARPAFNYLDRQIRSYVGGP